MFANGVPVPSPAGKITIPGDLLASKAVNVSLGCVCTPGAGRTGNQCELGRSYCPSAQFLVPGKPSVTLGGAANVPVMINAGSTSRIVQLPTTYSPPQSSICTNGRGVCGIVSSVNGTTQSLGVAISVVGNTTLALACICAYPYWGPQCEFDSACDDVYVSIAGDTLLPNSTSDVGALVNDFGDQGVCSGHGLCALDRHSISHDVPTTFNYGCVCESGYTGKMCENQTYAPRLTIGICLRLIPEEQRGPRSTTDLVIPLQVGSRI